MNKIAGKRVYWTRLNEAEAMGLHLAATDNGLCYIGSPGRDFTEAASWLARRFPSGACVRDDAGLAPYAAEVTAYLKGQRTRFSFPYELHGTPFQQAVWQQLLSISYGETTTYAQIAAALQQPRAARAVGAAIGANPLLIVVPCHRVIGKDGGLTGYRGGLAMKTALLRLEREHVPAFTGSAAAGGASVAADDGGHAFRPA